MTEKKKRYLVTVSQPAVHHFEISVKTETAEGAQELVEAGWGVKREVKVEWGESQILSIEAMEDEDET
jgi:hypothetical protein